MPRGRAGTRTPAAVRATYARVQCPEMPSRVAASLGWVIIVRPELYTVETRARGRLDRWRGAGRARGANARAAGVARDRYRISARADLLSAPVPAADRRRLQRVVH